MVPLRRETWPGETSIAQEMGTMVYPGMTSTARARDAAEARRRRVGWLHFEGGLGGWVRGLKLE